MSSQMETKHEPRGAVQTEAGLLSGFYTANETWTFLGVPYAAPPVGDLRWRPPQRTSSWTGVRPADQFGACALQMPPPEGSLYFGGETNLSEDCLYLNIYTGQENEEQKRPVMVYFHFGAFAFGSASNQQCDGMKVAAQGITVVTVNYRLGRMGFLVHPELSAESGHGASGNYGLMDQIAALQWVQRNIEAFGGDPKKVTVAGVSAGGSSVHILRTSPLARGLFSGVICESGPGLAPVIEGDGHFAGFTSLSVAEQAGVELVEIIGAKSIAELRKMPAEKILTPQLPRIEGAWKADLWPGSTSLSIFDTGYPIIDGYLLPESPLTAYNSGRVLDVPMLAGNVGNDAAGLPHLDSLEEYKLYAKNTFGNLAEEALRLYPASTDSQARAASEELLMHQTFVYSTLTSACLQAQKLKAPAWYYRFMRAPPISADAGVIEREHAGAFHGAAGMYAFGNLEARQWDWTDGDKALSRDVGEAWVRFVKTGDPNGSGHEDSWPCLSADDGLDMRIRIWTDDCGSQVEVLGSRMAEVTAFWDKHHGLA